MKKGSKIETKEKKKVEEDFYTSEEEKELDKYQEFSNKSCCFLYFLKNIQYQDQYKEEL